MRGRTLGLAVGLGAAFLALRPVGPVERLLDLLLVPTRVTGPLGILTGFGASSLSEDVPEGSGAAPNAGGYDQELDLSLRLERAVLRSAWPDHSAIAPGVLPVPGEVDARQGTRRDHIMVRVSDATPVEPGHPVVAGDAYVGRVERIPSRQGVRDDPGLFERVFRALGLASAPAQAPEGIVEVALITGAKERVGANVLRDQDGRGCRLVAGGLSSRTDRIWLAVHNPESRVSRSGQVVVQEPLGRVSGFDSLAEGFLIGELRKEPYVAEGKDFVQEVLGIEPPVDFESGLNQVLILTGDPRASGTRSSSTDSAAAARAAAVAMARPVMEDGGWLPSRLVVHGDTAPWRSTARLNRGSRQGIGLGAALVEGVRLVGRVARSDSGGATVALIDDPGFEIALLAQAVKDPDAEPLVLGTVRSLGSRGGLLRFQWSPEASSRHLQWCAQHAVGESVPVRLFTGSGMLRVPRGLLLGTSQLTPPAGSSEGEPEKPEGEPVILEVRGVGKPRGALLVRHGARPGARAGGSR